MANLVFGAIPASAGLAPVRVKLSTGALEAGDTSYSEISGKGTPLSRAIQPDGQLAEAQSRALALPADRLFDGRAGGPAAAESLPAAPRPPARSGPLIGPWPPPKSKTPAPPASPDFISRNWSAHKENPFVTAALYFPRLIWNLARQLVTGEIAHRLANLAVGVYQALRFGKEDHWTKAGYKIAESPLNPLAVVNDAVSDAGASLKWLRYSTGKPTSRIQVCTSNLSSAMERDKLTPWHFVDPAKHVAVLVDRQYETSDPEGGFILSNDVDRGGISCEDVPILSGEPESLAIERLECVDQVYTQSSGYEFGGYNCGGYTKDILAWSGLGFPKVPNVGIGIHYSIGPSEGARRARELKEKVIARCDAHVRAVQQAIRALESGTPLDDDTKNRLVNDSLRTGKIWLSPDVRLQILTSAARGNNALNRAWIAGQKDSFRWYSNAVDAYHEMRGGRSVIKRSRLALLSGIFGGLDSQGLAWLAAEFPEASLLRQSLTASEAAR